MDTWDMEEAEYKCNLKLCQDRKRFRASPLQWYLCFLWWLTYFPLPVKHVIKFFSWVWTSYVKFLPAANFSDWIAKSWKQHLGGICWQLHSYSSANDENMNIRLCWVANEFPYPNRMNIIKQEYNQLYYIMKTRNKNIMLQVQNIRLLLSA